MRERCRTPKWPFSSIKHAASRRTLLQEPGKECAPECLTYFEARRYLAAMAWLSPRLQDSGFNAMDRNLVHIMAIKVKIS